MLVQLSANVQQLLDADPDELAAYDNEGEDEDQDAEHAAINPVSARLPGCHWAPPRQ